jgi:hypothetical protein
MMETNDEPRSDIMEGCSVPLASSFDRRLCVCADVQSYGKDDDRTQFEIQHELIHVLDMAAAAAGLDRSTWLRQGKGDEELA